MQLVVRDAAFLLPNFRPGFLAAKRFLTLAAFVASVDVTWARLLEASESKNGISNPPTETLFDCVLCQRFRLFVIEPSNKQ